MRDGPARRIAPKLFGSHGQRPWFQLGMTALGEHLTFFRQAIRALREVGALSATSQAVANTVVAPIAPKERPIRVLEVGAGTGAITQAILSRLSQGDHLDLYEINPAFAAVLRQTVGSVSGPMVKVYEADIESVAHDVRYDFIVSSLPLLNLPPDKVDRIFVLLLSVLKPGGTLSYYDYWAKELRQFIHGTAERQRVREVLRVTRGYLQRYQYHHRVMFTNVPPASIHYLRTSPAASE
ncbi:MAG: methyltransferase domain-containing protein [Deltaproteobacteria bacterium]|nr:methyltransferase domain-containing protein [Deltaproteobacteria bacterium]